MMPYVSLDIETTGFDPEQDQLLQLAMVLDNDPEIAVKDLPHFNAVLWHERITGHPKALVMNADLIEFISEVRLGKMNCVNEQFKGRGVSVCNARSVLLQIAMGWLRKSAEIWMHQRGRKITVAGKNVAGFDLRFLGPPLTDCFHYRALDVGSMAMGAEHSKVSGTFWDDEFLPSLSDIVSGVTHDALDDARAVVRAVRGLRP